MSRKIQLRLGGRRATALLLDELNRAACDVFWENVPFSCTVFHTLVSGKNIHTFIPEARPFFEHAPALERRLASEPGTIFSPDPRRMFVKYGADSEDRSFAPVARVVPEDLSALEAMGQLAWDSIYASKEPRPIEVIRVDDERSSRAFDHRLFHPSSFESPRIAGLVADINREIEAIWLSAPDEVTRLYSGRHSAETGLGSHGRFFSTLLFVEKETSRISNVASSGAIDNLLRLCRETDVDLAVLKEATRTFCGGLIEFLGMCGQTTFTGLYRRAIDAFGELESKQEYFRLFSTFSLYATRFNAWHLHLFPWSLGDGYAYSRAS